MTYLVWYCQNMRCHHVLKTEPKGILPKGCKCKVPMLPKHATKIVLSSK